MKWLAFPTKQAPKILVGPGDKLSNALCLYQPGSLKGKITKILFSVLPSAVTTMLFSIEENGTATKQLLSVCRLLQNEHVNISISTGTPGPHRKTTAQITFSDGTHAYAKIGDTKKSVELIKQEHEILLLLTQNDIQSFIHPNVTVFESNTDYTTLIQSCPEKSLTRLKNIISVNIIETLCSMMTIHSSELPIDKYIKRFDITAHGTSDNQHSTLHNATKYLKFIFSDTTIKTNFCHGDFAPWNMMSTQSNKLYIFDWEYASIDTAALFDFIHFIFMPSKLITQKNPRDLIRHITCILTHQDNKIYLDKTGIDYKFIPAYIILYLLDISIRNSINNIDPYIIECIHTILINENYSKEPKRILVSAYACEPDEGSEPGVGWNMVNAISENNEAWVFTKYNNKTSIEAALAANPNLQLHFIYIDLPRWLTFWKKGGRGVRTYYYIWQLRAYFVARRLNKNIKFDMGHHITFVCDWLFTFQALLPIPFIWGPIGSNPLIPRQLALDTRSIIRDRARFLFQIFMRTIDPMYWISVIRAKHIISIEESLRHQFPFKYVSNERFSFHTAIGVESLPVINETSAYHDDSMIRVLTVGKLLPVKGIHLAIEAFSHFNNKHPNSQLQIVGSGPTKDKLTALCHSLDISDNVIFTDWMPRNDVLDLMHQSDVFLFPTFEGAGMVVLEAMANQLPVICLDFGGPKIMLGEHCGFKIPVRSKKETVIGLSNALSTYANEPSLITEHGINARKHVDMNYLWSKRADSIRQWYYSTINSS